MRHKLEEKKKKKREHGTKSGTVIFCVICNELRGLIYQKIVLERMKSSKHQLRSC